MEVLELVGVVGVGVDRAEDAGFGGALPPAPVHVEAHGVGVELEDGSGCDGAVDDFLVVDGVGFAFEEETSGEVADHVDVGVLHGADDAGGHFGFGEGEGVVDGGDGVVELFEDAVVKVEAAVLEDVHFGASEEAEGVAVFFKLLVELVDLFDLSEEAVFVEAVGLEGGLGVVGDAEIAEAEFAGGGGHFGEGVFAVGSGGVVVEGASEVGEFDKFWQCVLGLALRALGHSSGFDFASVFAQGGVDGGEAEVVVEFVFGLDGGSGVFLAVNGGGEAVFVEGEVFLLCEGAEVDVVFLGAGEVLESEGELGVADGAEIDLEATFSFFSDGDADGGFGFALGDDFGDLGELGEVGDDFGGGFGGDDQVEVVEGFFIAAVGACDVGLGDVGVVAEGLEEGFGEGGDAAEAMALGVEVFLGDAVEDFFLGFFGEAGEGGDAVVLAGGFEGVDGVDVEGVVEELDFLGAEALEFKELEEAFGEFGAEALVEFEGAVGGGGEVVELVAEGGADAFDADEVVGASFFEDVAVVVGDGVGAGAVGADLEGVFAFEFHEEGDFGEDVDEGVTRCWGGGRGI